MRFFLFALIMALANLLQAQQDRLHAVGLGLNHYGLAVNYKYHHAAEPDKAWTRGDFFCEFGNIMHPRELVVINQTIQNSGAYKLDKINYAWTMRNYYQVRRELSPRQDRKNIALNWIAGAGVPICYYWPVYILYFDPTQGSTGEVFTQRYDPSIHEQQYIAGRAPFYTGMKQGKFMPGLGLHSALEFIWGNYRSDVKILTIGARVEGYGKAIPILYRADMNKRLFSMFYLNFAFGFGTN